MANRTMQTALFISLIYALFGAHWIIFSTRLLVRFVSNPHQLILAARLPQS